MIVSHHILPSTLNGVSRALECMTSDDLCLKLAVPGLEWKLYSLAWQWPEGAASLLDREIVGIGDEIAIEKVKEPKSKRKKVKDHGAWSAMNLGDPMNLPEHDCSGDEHGDGGGLAGAGGGLFDAGFDAAYGDDEFVEGLRPDEVDVIEEEMGIAMDHKPVPNDEFEEVDSDDSDDHLDEDEGEPTIMECIDAALTGPLGYITCPLGRWRDVAMIGRIITWPASKPIAQRSVSVRCYLHPTCTSPAKLRHSVSDRLLYGWLFLASMSQVPLAIERWTFDDCIRQLGPPCLRLKLHSASLLPQLRMHHHQ